MNPIVRRVLRGIRNASGPLLWPTLSYAQEGEDLVIKRWFDGSKPGFYVEVGCHHPFRFSNTYLFYKRGWRGLCIDPLPGTARSFKRWRPKDIVLEMGVSEQPSTLTYYMFDEPAVNTFDPGSVARVEAEGKYRLVDKRSVPTKPLGDILREHLPAEVPNIDFFSIDVEGLDLQVLQSNDWQRFRPSMIVAECMGCDMLELRTHPTARLLEQYGYRPWGKTGHSVIFTAPTDGAHR
jgi:FkbM family methyltransferase